MKKRQGFTLIELLIVIGVIAILAGIIYVAVDPARRLAEARNAERWSSVNAVLNAVLKYTVDQSGLLPATATAIDSAAGTVQIIGEGGTACDLVTCTGETVAGSNCFVSGLDTDLVDNYLAAIPEDPSTGSAANTRYFINKSANGRITVGACAEETVGGSTPVISVSR
ncbi:MAG: prepilin-type N-terminal cleavage/methylation domain-containing protein [Patescibacteria group bacterium]|jgi:type IV pilus assembly protein PilA